MATRIYGETKGLCSAVVDNGVVYAVATDPNPTPASTIEEQTRNTLTFLESHLNELGSDRTSLLQATVYLTDMKNKRAMNEIWCEWIGGKENWPQRACVGAALDPGYLIEVVVTAKTVKE